MYACGVTVYDFSHLGHARSALVFDVIRRYLEYRGYEVLYVRNFTDVDDKIIHRAVQEGTTSEEVAGTYLKAYQDDMERVGVRPANREPKATDHMSDIIAMIERLIHKGYAYPIEGSVYFSVPSFPAYGRLSKRKLEDLLVGARVEVDERKQNPMDFALWKGAKPGEPSWDSPWGAGRPGWHIECSAMSIRHLGETFDIHGGGMDLIFPHHENEIAQSCASTGKEFAKYWIHNGFVQINKEKMSKSLGNFFTIREIFEKCKTRDGFSERVTGEVLRYFLLATHYRSPLDFSDQGLQETKNALEGFYNLFQRLDEVPESQGTRNSAVDLAIQELKESFSLAMDDDFNTPEAIGQFQSFKSTINRMLPDTLSKEDAKRIKKVFFDLGKVLGLFQFTYRDWQAGPQDGLGARTENSESEIERKLAERLEAKGRKDYQRADEIRQELASWGITIEDKPDGTSRWKR